MKHKFQWQLSLLLLLFTLQTLTVRPSQPANLDEIQRLYQNLEQDPGHKKTQKTTQVLDKYGTRFYNRNTVNHIVTELYAMIAQTLMEADITLQRYQLCNFTSHKQHQEEIAQIEQQHQAAIAQSQVRQLRTDMKHAYSIKMLNNKIIELSNNRPVSTEPMCDISTMTTLTDAEPSRKKYEILKRLQHATEQKLNAVQKENHGRARTITYLQKELREKQAECIDLNKKYQIAQQAHRDLCTWITQQPQQNP